MYIQTIRDLIINLLFYQRQEYDFHDAQMCLINTTLNESANEREQRAGRYLHQMRQADKN